MQGFVVVPYHKTSLHNKYAVARLVDAQRYKPEGHGFSSQWGHWRFFSDLILPAALCPLGSTQPSTEMSTRDIFWGVKAAGA